MNGNGMREFTFEENSQGEDPRTFKDPVMVRMQQEVQIKESRWVEENPQRLKWPKVEWKGVGATGV